MQSIRFLNKHDALSINSPRSPIDDALRDIRSAHRLKLSFKIGAAICVSAAAFFWLLGVLHFARVATEFVFPWASDVIGTVEMIMVTFLVVGTIVACAALIHAIMKENTSIASTDSTTDNDDDDGNDVY